MLVLLCCSCNMELLVRLEVRGERSYIDAVKEGKREGS